MPFLILGAAGLALSTLHLGRKERAWRAALNWRRSWLSREVMAVPLFLALAAVHLLFAPSRAAGALAAAAGVAALVCMDRVYVVMAREKRPRLDDAAARHERDPSSPALWPESPGCSFRRLCCGSRPSSSGCDAAARLRDVGSPGRGATSPSGCLAPVSVWLLASSPLLFGAWTLVAVAELADRAHFYDSLEVVTPRSRMTADLAARLTAPAA